MRECLRVRLHVALSNKRLCDSLSGEQSEPYKSDLVLISEAAADSFARFVGESCAGHPFWSFAGLRTGRIANELHMFHVPLAPNADPEMKLEFDPLANSQ